MTIAAFSLCMSVARTVANSPSRRPTIATWLTQKNADSRTQAAYLVCVLFDTLSHRTSRYRDFKSISAWTRKGRSYRKNRANLGWAPSGLWFNKKYRFQPGTCRICDFKTCRCWKKVRCPRPVFLWNGFTGMMSSLSSIDFLYSTEFVLARWRFLSNPPYF